MVEVMVCMYVGVVAVFVVVTVVECGRGSYVSGSNIVMKVVVGCNVGGSNCGGGGGTVLYVGVIAMFVVAVYDVIGVVMTVQGGR